MVNRSNNVAGANRRRCNNVEGERGRRRFDCDFVFECLLELLEDALEEENNKHHHCDNSVSPNGGFDRDCRRRRRFDCDDVFECLEELLEEDEDRRRCRKNK